MAAMRKIIALTLLPILISAIFVFVVGSAVDSVLLNGGTFTSRLRAANAYEVGVREIIHAIETHTATENTGTNAIGEKDLAIIATNILDPVWVQREIEANIGRLDGWLNHGRTLELSIDTTSRKPVVVTTLNNLLERKFASLPRCAAATSFHTLNDLCVPEGTTLDMMRSEMKKTGIDVDAIVTELPDHIDLLNPQASLSPFLEKLGNTPTATVTNSSSVADSLDRFRNKVFSFRTGMRLLLVGIITLLGIEAVLLTLGRKTFFRWMSLFIIISAILPAVVGAIGLLGAGSFIDQRVSGSLTSLLPETRRAIDVATTGLVSSLFLPVMLAGAALFVIGIGFGVASTLSRDTRSSKRV